MSLYQLEFDQVELIIGDLNTRYDLGLTLHGRTGLRAVYTMGRMALCIEALGVGTAVAVVGDRRTLYPEARAAVAAIERALAPSMLDRPYAGGKARAMQTDIDGVVRIERWQQQLGPSELSWPMERIDWETLRLGENPELTRVDLAIGWDEVVAAAGRMEAQQAAAAEIGQRSAAEWAAEFLAGGLEDLRSWLEGEIEEAQRLESLRRQGGGKQRKGGPTERLRRDSGHYHHPYERRRKIVEAYRKGQAEGKITNKEAWAQATHGITGNTLRAYEAEFPESEA